MGTKRAIEPRSQTNPTTVVSRAPSTSPALSNSRARPTRCTSAISCSTTLSTWPLLVHVRVLKDQPPNAIVSEAEAIVSNALKSPLKTD